MGLSIQPGTKQKENKKAHGLHNGHNDGAIARVVVRDMRETDERNTNLNVESDGC